MMSEVPNPVSSWHDVFRNPPVDLNLALRQDEVSPVPHESGNSLRMNKNSYCVCVTVSVCWCLSPSCCVCVFVYLCLSVCVNVTEIKM